MPEALARMRRDAAPSGRARPAAASLPSTAFSRLRAMPARGYAAAALTAVLVGIVINALTLQHERHPAPFFARATAQPSPAPAPLAGQPAAEPAPPAPPARPAQLNEANAAASRGDAIGDILRADQEQETQKLIAAAQGALIRLGYVVKTDGELNAATITALHDFEHSHGLAPSTAVTAKLLKTLTAAADAAGR
ncbi:MAG: hypothetical protein E7774_10730 [Bradyrhizobium sp.]|nr:MAG: hypothetical protein E7774_10730 [Bradyrhizobium sp.]